MAIQSRHGGVALYPSYSESWEDYPKNLRGFSKWVEEGSVFCVNDDCKFYCHIITDGEREVIWNHNSECIHYFSKRCCNLCGYFLNMSVNYVEILYVSSTVSGISVLWHLINTARSAMV